MDEQGLFLREQLDYALLFNYFCRTGDYNTIKGGRRMFTNQLKMLGFTPSNGCSRNCSASKQ